MDEEGAPAATRPVLDRAWKPALLLGAAIVAVAGLAIRIHPRAFAGRFTPTLGVSSEIFRASADAITLALGAGALIVGLAGLTLSIGRLSSETARAVTIIVGTAGVYLCLTWPFRDWLVDDAAITFAYAENLVRGHGLVLHVGHRPEEAYSNTLWLLLLAGLRGLGADIARAAKDLGLAIGVATVVVTLRLLGRLRTGRPTSSAIVLTATVLLTAPFVIWSISGLEHGLQALLLIAVVATMAGEPPRPFAAGLLLAALVLLRPEAPFLTGVFFGVLVLRERLTGQRVAAVIARVWPTAVLPLITFAALLAFRLAYFGDPLPNPYYAKATEATFARLLSPFGAGWEYVGSWLRASALLVLVPVIVALPLRRAPRAVHLAAALLAAQIAFVVYAGGDWMSHWRFLAPVAPLLAVLAGYALDEAQDKVSAAGARSTVSRLGYVCAAFIALSTVRQLLEFRCTPTTSAAVVTEVGLRFVALARALGIDHPRLAHHDAGGTSYGADLDVVDLAGLGDRAIAKHLHDPVFMERYLLDEMKPDFVFGTASMFAAAWTGFHLTDHFRRDYVALEFVDCPAMVADLSYLRRDRIRSAPGLELVRDHDAVTRVRVLGCQEAAPTEIR